MNGPGSSFMYPKFLKRYSKKIMELYDEHFKKVLAYVESVLFSNEILEKKLSDQDKAFAKELRGQGSQVTSFGTMYVSLMRSFTRETSEDNFIENLSRISIEKERAKLSWDSLTKYSDRFSEVISNVRLSLLPNLSELVWRVDQPISSTGRKNINGPIGIMNLKTDEAGDAYYLQLEVDIVSLSYLMENS